MRTRAAGAETTLRAAAHRCWEDLLPTFVRYGRIPCLSPDFDEHWDTTGHLAEAASLLRHWAASRAIHGLTAEVIGTKGRTPLLVVDAAATAGASGTVLVYGHLDKQPPLGDWREGLGPFTPVREGDRLYGRGTVDDGHAVFAAVTAMELLDAARIPRPRTVVLIESSEESGSPDLAWHLDHVGDRIGHVSLVICLDSGGLSYDRLWLTTSLRGNLVVTITVQVLTEGVHSGDAGGIVPTSFRLLCQLLDRLEDPGTGEMRLSELRAEIPQEAAGQRPPYFEVLPVVPGLELAGDSEADRLIRRAWSPALTVTGIDGIPAVRDGGNVLRPSTTAKVSLRLPPTVVAEKAAAAVVAALSADPPSGARVGVHVDTPATGWLAPPLDRRIQDACTRASEEVFGVAPGTVGVGGTIPFLAMLGHRYPGVPLVATGAGGPGSNAHGPNEFLHLPMAEAVTVATARMLEAAGRTDGEV